MNDFSKLWDSEVKKLCSECVDDKFVAISVKSPGEISKEDMTYFYSKLEEIKDPYGMYYISEMIFRVEHALCDNRLPLAKIAIQEVLSTVKGETYLKNCFGYDSENEEYKRIMKMADGLEKLMKVS